MSEVTSLNAQRKRRAGLADTGCCPRCGRYRMFCNQAKGGCVEFPDVEEPEPERPFPNGRPSFRLDCLMGWPRRRGSGQVLLPDVIPPTQQSPPWAPPRGD